VAHVGSESGDDSGAIGDGSSTDDALKGVATQSSKTNAASTLVLPSVPVDTCWTITPPSLKSANAGANSEAGQAAHLTNPAGFANVRAHAEAHLRAMVASVATPAPVAPTSTGTSTKGKYMSTTQQFAESTNGAEARDTSSRKDLFALTDEQILEIVPEDAVVSARSEQDRELPLRDWSAAQQRN